MTWRVLLEESGSRGRCSVKEDVKVREEIVGAGAVEEEVIRGRHNVGEREERRVGSVGCRKRSGRETAVRWVMDMRMV